MVNNPFSRQARKQRKVQAELSRRNDTLVLATLQGNASSNTGIGETYISPVYEKLIEKVGVGATQLVHDWNDPDQRKKIMNSAEWAYEKVPQVWTSFNRLAETTVKAIKLRADVSDVVKDFWNRELSLRVPQLLLINSLKFGSALYEPNMNGFKVRDTRDFEWAQAPDGTITSIKQRTDKDGSYTKDVDKDKIRFLVLHPRFSDDRFGTPAVLPALADISILRGMINAGYTAFKNYAAPVVWIETPPGVSLADRQDIQTQLRTYDINVRLVLPPGCKVHTSFEKGQFIYADLKKMVTEQIVIAMGIGQISMGIPEGSNRSTSRTQQSLLYDQIIPYANLLAVTLSKDYKDIFGVDNAFQVQELSSEDVLRKSQADMRLSLAIYRLQQVIDSPNLTPDVRDLATKRIKSLLELETARSV